MIAIHSRSGSFSDRWIEYCEEHNIKYKIVDAYSSDIVNEIHDCSGLMWHWHHSDHKSVLFARQLIYSLEKAGKKIFPNFATCWHFDDKVGQKYLLESINASLVDTYVFYDIDEARHWAYGTSYPKVFKLRSGAGSENVRLIRSKKEAFKLIAKAFGRGFSQKSRVNFLKERIWHFRREKDVRSLLNISKGLARLVVPHPAEKKLKKEKNYVYFQEFIADNRFDIRIIVIGARAFGIKRMVRKGDFRASGSGQIDHRPGSIPKECIKMSFDVAERVGSQCIAIDYVFNKGVPLVVELSYAFSPAGYLECPGYWNKELNWVEGRFRPQDFMLIDFWNSCNAS